MEANVSVNIRMKPELKRQFKTFCTDMGLSMTEAFNLLAQKAVNEYKMPLLGQNDNVLSIEAVKKIVSKLIKNIRQNMQFYLALMHVAKQMQNLI